MKKILFVCHGNICRSPMAELICKHEVEKRGLNLSFDI
ncbi:MAG: low molecular weight phosphotyrosine protein phosphatase, partial [Treponemataceae bacterium]|nr:low molecular weight phosphotyrosine protein phosphatase [Treponemataceae bacterium]